MFAKVQCPESLSAAELDAYLEKGWFRMGQTIFTTNFLNFKDQYYSAVWLRIALDGASSDKTYGRLMKYNAGFRIEIQEMKITAAKEALFKKYKQRVSFEASSSLNQLMFGKSDQNIYNTREINIYDGQKLIACGFFDTGSGSAAGITSFYDPAYKKHSLGKYLIYLKIEHCRQEGIRYFYPGYFVPGYSFFDYKLSIHTSSIQFLDLSSSRWSPIGNFQSERSPYGQMTGKLLAIQKLLAKSGVTTMLVRYEYFDANLIPDLMEVELFDYPLMLLCDESAEGGCTMIVFNSCDQHYHLVRCRSVWRASDTKSNTEAYGANLLKSEYDQSLAGDPGPSVSEILGRYRDLSM